MRPLIHLSGTSSSPSAFRCAERPFSNVEHLFAIEIQSTWQLLFAPILLLLASSKTINRRFSTESLTMAVNQI